MAVRLSKRSYEHAKQLIREGKVVLDERDDWSEHRPSTRDENELIEAHGLDHAEIEKAVAHLHGMLEALR
jgi:hypothetical protein